MAYTTIDDPSAYFQTTLYTGDGGGTRAVTHGGNSDLNADWVWIKDRGTSSTHYIFDSVRGVQKHLSSASNSQELSDANSLKAFNSNSFTLGTSGNVNGNSRTFASWNWKAGGASTSTNSDGDINGTQTVSQTAGFSVTTYSGNGGSNQRLGHGLGVTPKIYILKRRDNNGQWVFVNTLIDGTLDYLFLETTGAKSNSGRTLPTSSVVYLENGGDANESGGTHVMYAFAEKKGYSKFGSYTGNGSTDGTFVYTGFKPAFIIAKESSEARDWQLWDNKRLGYNASGGNKNLIPNKTDAEDTYADIDILSNGFKLRNSSAAANKVSQTYIYMAFAENPFVTSTGVPACAR